MLRIVYQTRFKKDAKKYNNDKRAQGAILETLSLLQTGEPLPIRYCEHRLSGDYAGYMECHGAPDLLLIYQRNDEELKLYRVGSHSELF
ncbi:type II toxin-antitoxin system YafQ family toxin [Rahnella victoriana]|uniref:Type II toxin-antitoxin system YafQ family toxin n=1 Tax=Rahnella victoriana TaxID=1510570 RepID=A0ABS0DWW6_9GAMM|nr:type II toxin-antitoxin system YafQ family toxin [Rahnella victoriana]MBF7958387.1 type II toxin-antitoxin system YafQ family toxin [Rahnella victoriana]